MVRAWDIQLDELTWRCEDVISKCYIIPGEPDQQEKNPLPNDIRYAATNQERQERFNESFELTDKVTWIVHSLLLPPDETIANMVNVDLPELDAEMWDADSDE